MSKATSSTTQEELGAHSPASSIAEGVKRDEIVIIDEKIQCESRYKTAHETEIEIDVNPRNLSKTKKWVITVVACMFTLLVSAATTAYTMGYPSMMRDLHCSQYQAVIGLTTYVLAFAVTPLLTSAFSEEFGRQPLYYASVLIFLSMHVAVAMAPNVQVVAVVRLIQGAAGSTGATMVAGTLADIWEAKDRGIPMALYSTLAFAGTAVGTISSGWIEMNARLGWKWIQWMWLIVGGAYAVIFVLTMRETRASVLYAKYAKKMGNSKEATAAPRGSLKELLWISCTRPLVLLLSEPIVLAMSIWLSFAWGIFYCMIGSIPQVFEVLHGFSSGEVGTVNVTIIIAVILGYLTTLAQEKIYIKEFQKRSVEARLHLCCAGGIGFPVSMIMYAWFCQPGVHWAFLCLALVIFYWSMFTIYLAVFNYLADCYTTYASSALAGQSMLRNTVGAVFPLFTGKIYNKLGYPWSNTIFAGCALLLAPIPFIIFFNGPHLRNRSKRCIHD